jgi:cytoskeletal protein CcmA (bactofilin family)
MFSKSKPTHESASSPSHGHAKMATGARHTTFSILGADVVVTGNVAASVDLHVDGKVEGDLTCAHLVQGEASEIRGSVVAESARLAGLVDGSITAKDLVIHASARITGDVTYDNLTIEQGGHVEGRFTHRRNAGAKPQLDLVSDAAKIV